MAIVPDAELCISYELPAFRLRGKTIAGFAAFKNHLSYLPHSGSVIPQLARKGDGSVHVHQGITALPCRRASAEGTCAEASGYADGRSFRQRAVLAAGRRPMPIALRHAEAW
jgi:hypothetical protein